jgi:AraC-like DNA-binding protein
MRDTIISGKSMAIFTLAFWMLSFFKILVSPEILFGLPVLNKTLAKFPNAELENKQTLNEDNNWTLETSIARSKQDLVLQGHIKPLIPNYILEVNKLSLKKLIFRNQKASQSDVAEALGIPKSHVVYLYKYHSQLSFTDFRMNSRVQDAIKLIENSFLNTETLESLAYTTGFASYNPFFTAFKKITNYSPKEYVKVKKELHNFTRDDKVHSLKL